MVCSDLALQRSREIKRPRQPVAGSWALKTEDRPFTGDLVSRSHGQTHGDVASLRSPAYRADVSGARRPERRSSTACRMRADLYCASAKPSRALRKNLLEMRESAENVGRDAGRQRPRSASVRHANRENRHRLARAAPCSRVAPGAAARQRLLYKPQSRGHRAEGGAATKATLVGRGLRSLATKSSRYPTGKCKSGVLVGGYWPA
jgi:hypothetical protein